MFLRFRITALSLSLRVNYHSSFERDFTLRDLEIASQEKGLSMFPRFSAVEISRFFAFGCQFRSSIAETSVDVVNAARVIPKCLRISNVSLAEDTPSLSTSQQLASPPRWTFFYFGITSESRKRLVPTRSRRYQVCRRL